MTGAGDEAARLAMVAANQPEYAGYLGMRLLLAEPGQVVMEMDVTEALSNRNGVLHGGAIMSLADNAGGTATMLNLPEGRSTTTMESKTNFIRPIRIGDTATATCTPLHIGRTTMIWQSTITRGDGKVAAVVTQTQMVIDWKG